MPSKDDKTTGDRETGGIGSGEQTPGGARRSEKPVRTNDVRTFGLLNRYPFIPAVLVVLLVGAGTATTIVLTQPEDPAEVAKEKAATEKQAKAEETKRIKAIDEGDCLRLSPTSLAPEKCGTAKAAYKVVKVGRSFADCGSAVGTTAVEGAKNRVLCVKKAA